MHLCGKEKGCDVRGQRNRANVSNLSVPSRDIFPLTDFIQIVQVLNNMESVTEPKLETSEVMIWNRSDPQLMNRYIPQSKPNVEYNFSDQNGFQAVALKKVSEGEAKKALRTLVDFMKTEVSERDQGLSYEPLFSQLIANKEKFLF